MAGQQVVWPIVIEKANPRPWGFCPGKATWDHEARSIFDLLLISAQTGALLVPGGLLDQPTWFIDLLGWFLPVYDDLIFSIKAERVLGSPKAQSMIKGA